MGVILALVNQKGGVGKTTTAVNLAAALHRAGKRVLLCDFDPQANATSGFGAEKGASSGTSYDIVLGEKDAASCVQHTPYGDLIPSCSALSGASVELVGADGREYALRRAIEPLREQYDYMFIDCPPSLELLTLNAICAADRVLIPVQCEYYALEGLSDLMQTLRAVKRRLNPTIDVFGVLLTMYDGRLNLTGQVVAEIKKYFADKLYKSVIPRAVRLSEAPSYGMPITQYDPKSKGAEAYMDFAEEFLDLESEEE